MRGPASEPVRALAAGRPDLAEHLLAPLGQLPGIQLRLEACFHYLTGTASPTSWTPPACCAPSTDATSTPASAG
ncbi:hypothetical protein [Streptomyces sp. NPDC059862]|uniref:hypothetical protein n=1 Tax=unclassified Streptomyces TaxID=2593676 RepID=UPI0036287829